MAAELVIHASEIVTGAGVRKKDGRRIREEDLNRIPDGAIVTDAKKILWVGRTQDLPKKYLRIRKRKNLNQKYAVLPGLIDCHTHLVFAGDRAREFSRRCAGATYEEIAQEGGGIQTTVQATREASVEQLVQTGLERLKEAYLWGVRTIEIKSGYGLDTESELKILKVIQELREKFPQMTILSTFLGAHAVPKGKKKDQYFQIVIDEMLPKVARSKLATSCDIFVDRGYFDLQDATRLCKKAQDLGLSIKVHGDELANLEVAEWAADHGAISVDHLLKVSEKGIRALAHSQTVAVLLPSTAFYLKENYAPARALIDAGAVVALSTDFNPGTSPTLSMPLVMTLAGLYMKMTAAEIFASVTFNAAKALRLEKTHGTLEIGKSSAFWITPFKSFEEIYYRLGWLPSFDKEYTDGKFGKK